VPGTGARDEGREYQDGKGQADSELDSDGLGRTLYRRHRNLDSTDGSGSQVMRVVRGVMATLLPGLLAKRGLGLVQAAVDGPRGRKRRSPMLFVPQWQGGAPVADPQGEARRVARCRHAAKERRSKAVTELSARARGALVDRGILDHGASHASASAGTGVGTNRGGSGWGSFADRGIGSGADFAKGE